jgi:predicted ATP-grasp superfamily ATP-dependent carboligase
VASESVSEARLPIAVVLGGDVNGLGQVRALGRSGIPVVVICADPREPAAHSRYARVLIVPKGDDYDARLVATLSSIARESPAAPPLFASSDAFVEFIARNRQAVGESCAFNIVDDATLQEITDKVGSHDLAKRCGLDAPRLFPLQHFVDEPSLASSFSYPALVKPRDSYTVEFPWKNKIVLCREDLERLIAELSDLVPHALVQEIIPGPEDGIYQCNVYIGRQVPTQVCTVQKIRQHPVDFGIMSFGRTRWMPSLVLDTLQLLESVGYSGFASVEYKRSAVTGRYYLIEINPRLPWYNSLFVKCGINYPLVAYRDQTGVQTDQVHSVQQRDGVYWLHLVYELRAARDRRKQNLKPGLMASLTEFPKARAFGLFSVTDPRPFLVRYGQYARGFFGSG